MEPLEPTEPLVAVAAVAVTGADLGLHSGVTVTVVDQCAGPDGG